MYKKLILLTFCSLIATLGLAQHRITSNAPQQTIAPPDSAVIDIITMQEGNELVGQVKNMTPTTLTFTLLNANSDVTIQRSLVKSTRSVPYKDYMRGYVFEHRGAPSLFASHTAFMQTKGNGQYETMSFIVSNMYDYGVSKNVSIGGGLFLYFPTIRVKVGGTVAPNVHLAAGTSLATLPFGSVDFSGNTQNSTPFFGATYAMATFGNSNHFLNVSAGVAYGSTLGANATIQVGGFSRFTPKTAIFGEVNLLPDALNSINYYNPIYTPTSAKRTFMLTNIGLRLLQRTTSWDLGLVAMSDPYRPAAAIFFPMVGFKAYVGNN
jgi:hypothetical protein